MKHSGVLIMMAAVAGLIVAGQRLDTRFATWFGNLLSGEASSAGHNPWGLLPSHTPASQIGTANDPYRLLPDQGSGPALQGSPVVPLHNPWGLKVMH